MQAARLNGSLGVPGTSLGFNVDFLENWGVPKTYSKLFNFSYQIQGKLAAGNQGPLRASLGLSGLLWFFLDLSGSLLACLGSINLFGPLWGSLWVNF